MAKITEGRRHAFVAGAGLTAAQYRVVRQDTDGSVVLATTATAKAIGILINQPAAGDTATVTLRNAQGTEKVVLGSGGCAVGDKLTPTTGGAVIVTTSANNEVIGFALEAGNAGDIVEILVTDRTV